MNLFENLQLMKESNTSIILEFKEFLNNKNAQYTANEINEIEDGIQIVIYDDDWKHEHLYMKHLLDEFFTGKGMDISIISEEIGESDQDTFSAKYDIIFNAKYPEYSADVISEDIDTVDEIRYVVTCQMTSNDDIYSEHSTLKDAITSARKAQQSFVNVKIKDLSDGSSWLDIDNAEQDLNDELYEGNHNVILDKDYATGEKIYNALVEYLNSLDQIGMDGKDCNWEPSNFNAKNLNADGEIYLVSGAYILIYPYINEYGEDYFKVLIIEANKLSNQIKNGIENIVNKFKTNKWKLVFEGQEATEANENESYYKNINRYLDDKDYLEEIQEIFPNAKRKGKLIVATK